MKSPENRFTLPTVSGARRSGDRTDCTVRSAPSAAKKNPEGIRRSSISGKPDIQNQQHDTHHNRHSRGTQIPGLIAIVGQFSETVDEALEFSLWPRLRK